MKKLLILLLSIVLVFCFASCGGSTDTPPEACTKHTDTNGDKKCDTCGATVESPECTTHTDTDGNGKCDACGATVEKDEGVTVKLIEDGVCNFKFVIGTGVNSSLRMEIDDLVSALGNIGIETEYVNDAANNVSECEVLIGEIKYRGDEYKFDKYSLGLEGYAIKPVGTKVIISAGDDAKLIDAFRLFVSDVLGFDADETDELTNVSLSTKDAIIEIQDNYDITDFKINGQSLNGYTIAVNKRDTVHVKCANKIQNALYAYTGHYLPIVNLEEKTDKSIVVELVPDDGEFGFKVYTEGNTLKVDCGFNNRFEMAVEDFVENKIVGGSGNINLDSSFLHTKLVRIVTYEEFGAVGDGRTNDFHALRKAHAFANECGETVVAKPGATYYIHDILTESGQGWGESIAIKTDTVWEDANFIIDDRGYIEDDPNNKGIFFIYSDYDRIIIDDPEEIEKIVPGKKINKDTVTKFNWTYGYKAMLTFINENEKHYIRKGNYDNPGGPQREIIIIDENGNITDNTGFMFDYEDVTEIQIRRVTDKPITIKGGTFTTIANDQPINPLSPAPYFSRGISVQRSNTTLDGLTHLVEGEEERLIDGQPRHAYSGFYGVSNTNNVTIQNCNFTARRYSKAAGTYDFSAGSSNNLTLDHCTQLNFYDENGVPTLDYYEFWGIGGTNYCKNLTYSNSRLSRFDAHEGLYNGKIINCEVSNLEIIGYGNLEIINTTFAVRKLPPVMLRGDYGCTWNGTLTLTNCTIDVTHKMDGGKNVLLGTGWYDWDFGYRCYFPNIIIDNLQWKGLPAGTTELYITDWIPSNENAHKEELSPGVKNNNPYTPPKFFKVLNNNTGYNYYIPYAPFYDKTTLEGLSPKFS